MTTRRSCRWLLLGGLLWFLLPACFAAQAARPSEYDVKAAYLFNFAKFVKWPDTVVSSRDTFPICILGNDPFGDSLDATISGEHMDGKKVVVRRITAPSDAVNCRILFIAASEQGRLSSILSAVAHSPVLTVSDLPGFVDHQGMIQFVMDNDRVRFQVDLSAAQKAGLTMSSELLKVATAVKGHSGE